MNPTIEYLASGSAATDTVLAVFALVGPLALLRTGVSYLRRGFGL